MQIHYDVIPAGKVYFSGLQPEGWTLSIQVCIGAEVFDLEILKVDHIREMAPVYTMGLTDTPKQRGKRPVVCTAIPDFLELSREATRIFGQVVPVNRVRLLAVCSDGVKSEMFIQGCDLLPASVSNVGTVVAKEIVPWREIINA